MAKIKIATMADLQSGKTIEEIKKGVEDALPSNLKTTIEENSKEHGKIEYVATGAALSFITYASKSEALELNLAKENISGIKGDTAKYLKRLLQKTRWHQVKRQRNLALTTEGIRVICIDVIAGLSGKRNILLKGGKVVTDYLNILYGADYEENYLLVEREEITTQDGVRYKTFAEYDRPAGVVRYWGILASTQLSLSSDRKKLSDIKEGAIDEWNYAADLGIDFLPMAISWNNEFGEATLKYQYGLIKSMEQLVDDFVPNWVATRSMYSVNELYMRAGLNAKGKFDAQMRDKSRIRTTKTNSNKYISEVSLLEGDPKTDALMTTYREFRSKILAEALLVDKSPVGIKQKNNSENEKEKRDPKKLLMDKAILRSVDDTILVDRLLIIAKKLGYVKKYEFGSVTLNYDLGFILSEKEFMKLDKTQSVQKAGDDKSTKAPVVKEGK